VHGTHRSPPVGALQALGYEGYRSGYFAGQSAPLGRVPAEVVDGCPVSQSGVCETLTLTRIVMRKNRP